MHPHLTSTLVYPSLVHGWATFMPVPSSSSSSCMLSMKPEDGLRQSIIRVRQKRQSWLPQEHLAGLVGQGLGGQLKKKFFLKERHKSLATLQEMSISLLAHTMCISVMCCVLCAMCYVPCAMCCVLCAVCNVLCAMCNVQCAVCYVLCAMCCVQCAMCCVQCAMCNVLCAMCYVQCAVCHVPCAMCHVQCAMCHVPCAMCCVLCATGNGQCATCYVLCSVCYVPCAMFGSPCTCTAPPQHRHSGSLPASAPP